MKIVIIRGPINECNVSTGHSCNRPGKAVVYSHLQASDVEVIEIAIQRCITVIGLQMPIVLFMEFLAEKISDVSKNNQDQVTKIGCKKVVVRRLVHDWLREVTTLIPTCVFVRVMAQWAELSMCLCDPARFCRRRGLK